MLLPRRILTAALAAALPLVVFGACAGKTVAATGLLVVVNSDLSPSQYDTIQLEIQQQTADGGLGPPIFNQPFSLANISLPADFAIQSGASPDQVVFVQAIALRGQTPVDLRQVEVQVPTDREAQLELYLSEACFNKLSVNGDTPSSTCGPGRSCQPTTGMCGSDEVNVNDLPNVSSNPLADDGGTRDGGKDAKSPPPDVAQHDSGVSDAGHDAGLDAGLPALDYYFMGRWDTTVSPATPSQPATEWAGATVMATFTGSEIAIDVVETPNALSSATGGGGFDSLIIDVDGTPTDVSPLLLNNGFQTGGTCRLPNGQTCVTGEVVTVVADGLAAGTAVNHTITITKATDPYYGGKIQFKQLIPAAGGSIVKKEYSFAHHIEWIGDDINVGRGIIEAKAPASCNSSNAFDVPLNTTSTNLASDATQSYVATVSASFNAEYHNISMATSGVYESLTTAPLIPAIYLLNQPDETMNSWPFSTTACTGSPCTTWVPDLIVINAGSYGDFTHCMGTVDCPNLADGGVPSGLEADIADAYGSFLTLVRTKYPATPILLVSGSGSAGSIDPVSEMNLVYGVMSTWVHQNAAETIGKTIAFYSDDREIEEGDFQYTGYTCAYYPDTQTQWALSTGLDAGQTPADTGVQGAIAALTGWEAQ